jgi:hypothetical protein
MSVVTIAEAWPTAGSTGGVPVCDVVRRGSDLRGGDA